MPYDLEFFRIKVCTGKQIFGAVQTGFKCQIIHQVQQVRFIVFFTIQQPIHSGALMTEFHLPKGKWCERPAADGLGEPASCPCQGLEANGRKDIGQTMQEGLFGICPINMLALSENGVEVKRRNGRDFYGIISMK